MLDAEGMIVEVNQACRQTTGFDLDRILGKSFVSVFVPPEDLDLVSGMFRHAIRNQAACQFESTLLTKDGAAAARGLVVAGHLQHRAALRRPWFSAACRARSRAPSRSQSAPTKGGIENRASPRRTFQYRQMIAPVTGNAMPSEQDFFEVDCADISAGGLSFYLSYLPDFEKLIVRLGRPPAMTHFAAQVVRHVEKLNGTQRQYLVGCRFLGRVQL